MISMNTKQVKELTGLTDDQINYLIKKVEVLNRKKSQGKAREYSFRDLVYLKLASVMRSDGLALPVINEAISFGLNEFWTNENPKDAGTLIRLYQEQYGKYSWLWYPYLLENDQVNGGRFPKYLYNVTYYATELAKGDQLELEMMLEEKAVN